MMEDIDKKRADIDKGGRTPIKRADIDKRGRTSINEAGHR